MTCADRCSLPWDRHSQRQWFLFATHAGVDGGLLNHLSTACLAAHLATAVTSSSLGSLADPGGSRSGCIGLISQQHRKITGANTLQPCLVQVPWVNGTRPIDALCNGTGTVSGCIRLISQRHREITGATPLATMALYKSSG